MRRAYVEADKCVSDHGCVTSIHKTVGEKIPTWETAPRHEASSYSMQRKMTRNENKAGNGNEIEGTMRTTRRK